MTAQTPSPQSILIAFLSQEDEPSDVAALTLARRMSQTCQVLLIEDQEGPGGIREARAPAMARQRSNALRQVAGKVGLDLKITVGTLQTSLDLLRTRPAGDVLILSQPISALDRQTLVFRKVEQFLSALPNDVLYAPGRAWLEHHTIISFAPSRRVAQSRLAARLKVSNESLKTIQIEKLAEIVQPQSALRLDIQAQAPAMILIEETTTISDKTSYSRLAAVLGVPVLVVTPPAD